MQSQTDAIALYVPVQIKCTLSSTSDRSCLSLSLTGCYSSWLKLAQWLLPTSVSVRWPPLTVSFFSFWDIDSIGFYAIVDSVHCIVLLTFSLFPLQYTPSIQKKPNPRFEPHMGSGSNLGLVFFLERREYTIRDSSNKKSNSIFESKHKLICVHSYACDIFN